MTNLSVAQLQKLFKNLGKLIYLSQLSPDQVTAYKLGLMALVEQAVSGVPADFAPFNDVLAPLGASVNALVNTINTVPVTVKTAITSYLTKDVVIDMGMAVGSPIGTTLTQLIASMNAPGDDGDAQQVSDMNVDPSGFENYFYVNYSVTLPFASGTTGNIDDAWITDDIV